MSKKHSISSLLCMLYIFYVMYLMKIISIARTIGIFSENNKITTLIPNMEGNNSSTSQVVFYYIFLGLICFAVISESRSLDLYEDENKMNVINRKLFKYKIFVAVNILLSIYLLININTVELLNLCILLNVAGIFICYGKSIYFKSYICNRRLNWLKEISQIDIDENIDTKWWRRKIWFNGREKVFFKYRINKIIISGFTLLVSFIFFYILTLDKSFIAIFFLYFILKNTLIIIEAIFGLYTLTAGKCTGIIKKSRNKNSVRINILGIPIGFTFAKTYYQIVLTDYNNRREIEILSKEYCGLSEMDTMEVVHGIFSKEAITINMIPTERVTKKLIIFNFITRLIPLIILIYTAYNAFREYEYYSENYAYEEYPYLKEDYTYEEDDLYLKQQREENIKEILPKGETYYKKIIEIDEEKDSENISIKIEKLYLDRKKSKLQFRIKNKTDVALVMNLPYETHIFDENDEKNSNILLPNKEYYCEMDILQPYKKSKYLNVNLEYTLSPYVMNEYMDYFYYLYYPLNVVDCNSNINIDLIDNKCKIDINEYGNFYNISEKIVEFTNE